jgi:predicted DCC family thiol-disulfide oxidoreductase YuxK
MDRDAVAPVVLFDGVCNLCTGSVQFILRHEADDELTFASLQSDAGQALLADCGLDPDQRESMVLVTADGCHTRSDAAVGIASHLKWPYRALGWTGVIPRPIRDAVYRLVARTRFRVFGRGDECLYAPDGMADRFLE